MTVALAPLPVKNKMIATVLERATLDDEQHVPFVVLAGAAARETTGLDSSLLQDVSRVLQHLVPPRDSAVAYQLARAGDLILPFLAFNEMWDEDTKLDALALVAQLDGAAARKLLLEYAGRVDLDLRSLGAFMKGLDYTPDWNFARALIGQLMKRGSMYFWQRAPRKRLYVGHRALLPYVEVLPKPKWLVLDGRDGLNVTEALALEWRSRAHVKRLSILYPPRLAEQVLTEYMGLEELDLVGATIDEFWFVCHMPNLSIVRLIDSEAEGWEAVSMSSIRQIYAAGAAAGQFYSLEEPLDRPVYLDQGASLELDSLERSYGPPAGRFGRWKPEDFARVCDELAVVRPVEAPSFVRDAIAAR